MPGAEVVVIDYGVGNLLSVQRGLEHCGATVIVSSDPRCIADAQRVVLPGVGAFGNAMRALTDLELVPVLREVAQRGTPFLGICLGMQLLLDESEEFGLNTGLGLIPGRVKAIPIRSVNDEPIKIPHIGWNALLTTPQNLWQGTWLADNRPGDAMYFVHSFAAYPSDETYQFAECIYGGHRVSAVIARDNIMGCQFHPEKSGEAGLKILRRFCRD